MSADVTMWSSEAWSSAADLYLLARSREGSAEAFGELWRRHLPAAYAVANRHRGRTAAEDIVAEASARVFALIRDGKGPDEHFRAYLLSAVRSVAVDHGRRELKVVPAEDGTLEELGEPVLEDLGSQSDAQFDAELIRTAFRGLSEQDQRVLWHTTVEGEAPRVLAPALGMTPNAVSARAMRAREALRAQYLDACAARSLDGADNEECRWAIAHLGAHVRGRLPKRQKARVEEHLRTCQHASSVAADLRAIHAEFPALVVPFVFLAGLGTAGFVSATAVAGLSAGTAAAGAATAGVAASGTAVVGAGGTTGVGGATGSGASSLAEAAHHAAEASSAAAGAGSGAGGAASSPPPSGVGDAVGQFASRATTLVAGIAIGAGLASAAQVPVEPVAARPPAAVATPTQAAAPLPAPAPPPPPKTSPASRVVVPPPVFTRPTATPRPAPLVTPTAPRRTSPPPRPPSPARPARPAPAKPPAPIPTPTPTLELTPAMATVDVVKGRDATTFRLRVRGSEGPVTIVVSTPAGAISLRNGSWSCTQSDPASITCTGSTGQGQFLQSGLDSPQPVSILITDDLGRMRTQTLSLD